MWPDEPATLAALARIGSGTSAGQLAPQAVTELLAANRLGGVDLVLRWLTSLLVNPAGPDAITAEVELLVAALPPASVQRDAAQAC